MKLGLSYDDVLIVPKYSEVQSRKDPNASTKLVGCNPNLKPLQTPIFSAPMDTVTEAEMAIAMSRAGGAGIIHRFCSIEKQRDMIEKVYETGSFAIGAVGLGEDELLRAKSLIRYGAWMILLDVAHAHTPQAADRIKAIKDMGAYVMAGNVATAEGFKFLEEAGADSIRVGIGPGAVCSTRIVTGIGYPQFSAVQECAAIKEEATLVADGGITHSGDIAKALAAGADQVMIGKLFAGADEAPGGTSYRGMASIEAQQDRQEQDGFLTRRIVAEGVSSKVNPTGPVSDTVYELVGGLKSSMSYVGALTLEEFRKNAEFVQVTPAGQTESRPRI